MGVILLPAVLRWNPADKEPLVVNHDPRLYEAAQFEKAHHFVTLSYTKDFIRCADESGLDWRVLLAISVVESSGGKHLLPGTNNWWGWNSGSHSFGTVPEGICYVSEQLANSHYYRGKTLEQKIKTYNSVNPNYWPNLQRLMAELNH